MHDIHGIKEIVESRESSITGMILTMKCDKMTQDQILMKLSMNRNMSVGQIQQLLNNMTLANGKLASAILEYIDTQQELIQLVESIS